jgi:1-phosphatidylinositol-3-phosphate 5-kinase
LALNEVRRAFLSSARGAERRLQAWQKKHLIADKNADKLVVQEPEWWDKTCHVVPGGNIIVREDDWGSIIAFTMRYITIYFPPDFT